MTKTNMKIRKLTMTALMAAVSTVLMFFSINVPLMPSFIKLDLSELPAIFGAFVLGPLSGVVICLVKNMINLFFSTTFGIGELSNFMLGVAFVLPAGLIYQKWRTKAGAISGALIGTTLMAVLSIASNFFIVYPVYFNLMPMEAVLGLYNVINPFVGKAPTNENLLRALISFNMPFTFIKGMISVVITFIIYKPMAPIIKGNSVNTKA